MNGLEVKLSVPAALSPLLEVKRRCSPLAAADQHAL
jgi:hypothetical protein